MRSLPKVLMGVFLAFIIIREWRKGYFKRAGSYREVFSLENYRTLLLLTPILALLLMTVDVVLVHFVQSTGAIGKGVAEFGRLIGRNINFWIILTGAYYVSMLVEKKSWPKIIFGSILASALTGLICLLLKFTFLRARPDANLGPFSFFNWDGLLKDDNAFQSFPSGDVALVGGAASFLFYSTKNRYLRVLFLLFPLCTAFSRINGSRHWMSDVVFSIGMSFIIAKMVWNYRENTTTIRT